MFENARVGDRVWSVTKGWGTVASLIRSEDNKAKVLFVVFDSGPHVTFHSDGKFVPDDLYPELYWEAIDFTSPPPPERWVTKEKWIAFFQDETYGRVCVHGPELCNTWEAAITKTSQGCPDPIRVWVKEKED